MDDRIKKLTTPAQCEIFAKNAIDLGHPELAIDALKRSIQLRANDHGAKSVTEKEALQAIYAYEEVLTAKNKRRTRATRTWQMIKRHGIIGAVERAVNRETTTQGYRMLAEMGLQEFAFEAVILRYPELFSEESIAKSRERLTEWST